MPEHNEESHRLMKCRVAALPNLLALLLLGALGLWAAPAMAAETAIDYSGQIAPLLNKYCNGCHNAADAEGELVLDTYEAVAKGGANGAVIAAGSPEASRLIRVLTGQSEPAMPPEGNPGPSDEEIKLLVAWVAAGAKGPDGAAPDPTVLNTPEIEVTGPLRQEIIDVDYSPDSARVAVARYREVELLDAAERSSVMKLTGHRGQVNAVVFSPDGKLLFAAAGEPGLFGEVRVWQVSDGKLLHTIDAHRDAIYALAVAPDGKIAATGSYDQTIKLWNVETGEELRTLTGHNGAVFDLAFSPSGRVLASASGDRTVKLWDPATGERLDTFSQPLKELYALAFSPDGRRLVAGGADNRIRLWQISDTAKEGTNPLLISRFAHEGPIARLAWSADGKTLVSAAEDNTLKFWDAAGLTERMLVERQPDWAVALAIAPDSGSVAVGRLDGSFAIYSIGSGKALPPRPVLAAISVRGIERGQATAVELRGKNLRGDLELKSDHPKLVGQIVVADDAAGAAAKAELRPAVDLPRGKYHIWVAHEGLETEKRPVYVDDVPQHQEAEPNNRLAEATEITVPASAWGVLSAQGEVDYFRFSAKKGETLVFDLAAQSLGAKANCVLTLFDPSGRTVAGNNDFGGQADPLIAYQVPADGEYIVQVTDLQRAGSDEHFYRLSIGAFPYVTAVYPLGVPAKAETEVELVGYNLPEGARATVKTEQPGEATVPIEAERYRFRQQPQVLVTEGQRTLEAEPNDTAAEATRIEAPGIADARAWNPDRAANGEDADFFRFAAKAGQKWMIETVAARRGSPIDTRLEVLDERGQPVPRLLLQAVRDSATTFRGSNSDQTGFRVTNWEEMDLNQYLYLRGEVCRIFRQPQGPDSDTLFYSLKGKRRGYFDTTPLAHALDEPVYVVEPFPTGARLVPNGLPVFTVHYENDDDSYREKGSDSRLTFVAPADGEYIIRVSDVRGFGGPRFAYRLVIREPEPDFKVRIAAGDWNVPAGSGKRFTVECDRIDEFDDDIRVEITGLPAGFHVASPVVIQAGHQQAEGVIWADADAKAPGEEDLKQIRVTASAKIESKEITKDVAGLGKIGLAPAPKLLVSLEPKELTIAPGTTITATLRIERNGFDEFVQFDVGNLPHGVIVDNIGLNGVLLPKGETERTIFLTAASWVPETDRTFQATALAEGNQTSAPVLLRVRKPATLAQSGSQAAEQAKN